MQVVLVHWYLGTLHVPKASQVQGGARSRKERKLTIRGKGELPVHHLIVTGNAKEYQNSKSRSISFRSV